MARKTIPAVSIIIPMYNAEKYVGECLDSILAQTFDDYEVIVVDDCSTDNSCKVVESYIPRFYNGGGCYNKLNLIKSKINSGSGGTPRNIGIKLSRGEYISCIDVDDKITPTALEELYKIASEFQADVVCCERYYEFHSGNDEVKIASYKQGEFVKEPTVIEDVASMLNCLVNKTVLWNLWSKLIRRDFILENDLIMIDAIGEDFLFTQCLFCSAKKIVLVPNIVNLYRVHEKSISNRTRDVSGIVRQWCAALIKGIDNIDRLLSRQANFLGRPDLKYAVFDAIAREFVNYLLGIYSQVPAHQLDEIIRAEFAKAGDTKALSAFMFGRMNVFNVNLIRQSQVIQQLQAQLQQK